MSGIGLNAALYLANSGLQVSRQQVEVSGRNLANSSTPGATRQSVATKAGTTVDIAGTPISSGVVSAGVVSARSAYLDALVQTENSNLGYAGTLDSFLQDAENALQESLSTAGTSTAANSTGLEASATAFYNAWSDLAANPNSAVYQSQVSSAAQSFISTAQSIYSGVLGVKSDGFTEAGTQVDQVNALASEIASVNKAILTSEATGISPDGTVNQANDLRDQRESLIEQLSSLVNISVEQDPENASLVDIKMADPSATTNTRSSATVFGGTSVAADVGTGLTGGTFTVNGTAISYNTTDSISQIADSINASVTGVSATVVNGKLSLNSASPITVADGTGNFVTQTGLATSTATVSSPIYLVSGTASGGATSSTHQTYALTVAGSDATTNESGYEAGASLTILATTSSGAVSIANPTGGSLGGLVYMDNTVIGAETTNAASFTTGSTLIDQFNTFINNVVTSVNSATFNNGTTNLVVGADGTAGENFFVSDTTTNTSSTGVFDLHLNNLYNSQSTSTYNGAAIPTGSAAATELDGANAQKIADTVGNSGILPYYQGVVSGVGTQRSAAATNLSAQTLLTTQATNQQQSYEGISTDDEMTNLLSFQRAFQASSRFINVLDQMYQLVDGLGT